MIHRCLQHNIQSQPSSRLLNNRTVSLPVVMILHPCLQHNIQSQPSSRLLNNRTVRFCASAICDARREHGISGHQVVLSRVSLPSGHLQHRTQCQSLAFRNPRRTQRPYTIQSVIKRWNVWYCVLQRYSKINSANSPASAASLADVTSRESTQRHVGVHQCVSAVRVVEVPVFFRYLVTAIMSLR